MSKQRAKMSYLALEQTVRMSADIARAFQATHCIELSPAACFSTFQTMMVYLDIKKYAEEYGEVSALDQSDFDVMYETLRYFATVWFSAGKQR